MCDCMKRKEAEEARDVIEWTDRERQSDLSGL